MAKMARVLPSPQLGDVNQNRELEFCQMAENRY
jgi:hypothetical protein